MEIIPFLTPRSIVLIGASTQPQKLGYGIARNLSQSGYPGRIYFVSQKTGELFGHPLYTRLAELPEVPELAVLILPAEATPAALQECARLGIGAAIIVSSGFGESGEAGMALERACLEIARQAGMRLLGPNCIGVIDTHLPLDTTFLQPPLPKPGGISFLSQSGAFCAAIIDWARQEGLGFARVISLGNQADLNESDFLPALADDAQTRVIVLYLEGLKEGERFLQAAAEAARHRPLLALKVGRSIAGQKAAASHTGALASADALFDAAFERAGILRAANPRQLFDWARALEFCPPLRGRRIAILTNAGGPGVIAADALEPAGLELASLHASTVQALAAFLPPAASLHNPVDMLASASPQVYAEALRVLLADEGVDGVLVILPPPPMYPAEAVAEALIPHIREQGKPVLIALMGSEQTAAARERFSAAGIPTYPFPDQAIDALGALAQRRDLLARLERAAPKPPEWAEGTSAEGQRLAALLDECKPSSYGGWVSAVEVGSIFNIVGIPVAPLRLARSAEEAVHLAESLGFPVVMKIASREILHKSDRGGVMLNLSDPDQVARAFTEMMARFAQRLDGVYLQPQLSGGQEIILGGLRDPNLGPFVLCGAGGVEVEAQRDVAFACAPLDLEQAEALLRRTWAGRRLWGYRGQPPLDYPAVSRALVALSWLVARFPRLAEVEINPLYVRREGVFALDSRLRVQ